MHLWHAPNWIACFVCKHLQQLFEWTWDRHTMELNIRHLSSLVADSPWHAFQSLKGKVKEICGLRTSSDQWWHLHQGKNGTVCWYVVIKWFARTVSCTRCYQSLAVQPNAFLDQVFFLSYSGERTQDTSAHRQTHTHTQQYIILCQKSYEQRTYEATSKPIIIMFVCS